MIKIKYLLSAAFGIIIAAIAGNHAYATCLGTCSASLVFSNCGAPATQAVFPPDQPLYLAADCEARCISGAGSPVEIIAYDPATLLMLSGPVTGGFTNTGTRCNGKPLLQFNGNGGAPLPVGQYVINSANLGFSLYGNLGLPFSVAPGSIVTPVPQVPITVSPPAPTDADSISLGYTLVLPTPCTPLLHSHTIADKSIRLDARVKTAPIPPGPPVMCILIIDSRKVAEDIGKLAAGTYHVELYVDNVFSGSTDFKAAPAATPTPTPTPVPAGKFQVPTSVTARYDGTFSYEAIYVPAGPVALQGYSVMNVANTTVSSMIADGRCIGPAMTTPYRIPVSGKLVNSALQGQARVEFSACNGDHFSVTTKIMARAKPRRCPSETVDVPSYGPSRCIPRTAQ